jgi:hypothetical protein
VENLKKKKTYMASSEWCQTYILGLGNITKRHKIKMSTQIGFKFIFIPCPSPKPFEPPFNPKLPKFKEEFEG